MRLAIFAMLAGCAMTANARAQGQSKSGQFLERSLTIAGKVHRYQVFVPAAQAAAGRPPIILFLHGSNERGDDNQQQTTVGIGSYVRRHQDDFPAIVVFPQAPTGKEWNQVAKVTLAQLDAAMQEFNADPDRVYLTGLSMGGFGVWDYALRAPERFAALVPICGGLVAPKRPSMSIAQLVAEPDPYAVAARKLKGVPTWIFHGAKDHVVPAEFSRRMDAALKTAGARDARYTEFPNRKHNIWNPTYLDTPELWTWLFAQQRQALPARDVKNIR